MAIASIVLSLNGQTYNLTQVSGTNEWTASVLGPSDTSGSHNSGNGPGVGANATNGYYPCTITITDEAGNVTTVDSTDSTYGSILRLAVEETTKPTCSISYPASAAYISSAQPTITWTVNDAGSGVNPSACYIQIDSGTAVAVTPSFNAAGTVGSCSYQPASALSEGQHTIKVYCTDYDGNTSVDTTVTFTVDTLPPTLNVSAPTDNVLINTSSVAVVGTTNDAGSSPVVVTITVGSTDYTPTIGQDGSFSQTVSLQEGANTVTIVAEDQSGKTTTITRTVNVDTIAPTVISITLTPNPLDAGATFAISVEATDP